MITESIAKSLGYRIGYLLHEGFEVKCAGQAGTDANGSPIVTDRHLVATLGSHLPGAQAHAIGNEEFTDDIWSIDPSQSAIDWTAPKCCLCQKELAP